MMDEVHVLLDKTYLTEMSDAICKFVRSAYASYFTEKELEDLNSTPIGHLTSLLAFF